MKSFIVMYFVKVAVVIIAGLLYSCIRKRKTGIIISIMIFVLFSVGWLIHGTENVSVTYAISYDSAFMPAGLYMK